MTTTEAVVTEIPKDEKEVPAMGGGMGGMGGMDFWGSFLVLQSSNSLIIFSIYTWCKHQDFCFLFGLIMVSM